MGAIRPELRERYAQIAITRARVLSPLVIVAITSALLISESSNIPLTVPIIGVNLAVISVISLLAALLWLRKVPARWAHAVAALVWWAPITTSFASYSATHNPRLFILLVLEMFCGTVMVSGIWLAGSFVLLDILWIPLALAAGGDDAVFVVATLISAQLFAIVIHRLVQNSLAQAEEHRLAAEHQLGETHRSEQARAELTEQLVHAQRLEAVGTLAAGLAHDMNNVLASIMGFSEGVIETSDDEQARADCTEILREAERGAELTRGLLTFSRRGHYRKHVLRIGDIVDEVVALLGRTLPKSLQLEKQLVDAEACIEGDPTQFGTMLVNLGINASDAMSGKGRLIVRAETIELAATTPALSLPPGRYARLRVSDTGSGMDEATRARVFEPFFTTKPMGKGTGLGLALVWGVVAKARGTVTVESELGKGSTFSIYLPLTDKQPPQANEVSVTTRLPQRGTVLVVDDEPAVRTSTQRMLERLGLRTLVAAGGAEGLKLFDAHASEIALVVLDMGMPGMNGAEVFRLLRERSQVKVLIATGYAMEEEVQLLVSTGARVLEKPFKIQALEQEIERALPRPKN
jgi:signal transduction histidine kinase/ActR/RegA family two-component response regulator